MPDQGLHAPHQVAPRRGSPRTNFRRVDVVWAEHERYRSNNSIYSTHRKRRRHKQNKPCVDSVFHHHMNALLNHDCNVIINNDHKKRTLREHLQFLLNTQSFKKQQDKTQSK